MPQNRNEGLVEHIIICDETPRLTRLFIVRETTHCLNFRWVGFVCPSARIRSIGSESLNRRSRAVGMPKGWQEVLTGHLTSVNDFNVCKFSRFDPFADAFPFTLYQFVVVVLLMWIFITVVMFGIVDGSAT